MLGNDDLDFADDATQAKAASAIFFLLCAAKYGAIDRALLVRLRMTAFHFLLQYFKHVK